VALLICAGGLEDEEAGVEYNKLAVTIAVTSFDVYG